MQRPAGQETPCRSRSRVGTAGSLLLLLAGINLNWIALVAGGTCAGAFMAAYQLAWGVRTATTAGSATPYVPRLRLRHRPSTRRFFHDTRAAAVFSALLPLVSGALFREHRPPVAHVTAAPPPSTAAEAERPLALKSAPRNLDDAVVAVPSS